MSEHIPGMYFCTKCDFTLAKKSLNPATGEVGLVVSNAVERCPNDGSVMAQLTWEKHCRDLHGPGKSRNDSREM